MARNDGQRDEKKITPRADDYSQWYHDIVLRAELADYAPVKGCMVIRPHGYAIWELMQQKLDKRGPCQCLGSRLYTYRPDQKTLVR